MLETKVRIAEALLELMESSELYEIQMVEIAQTAMVSDRTIRRHFKGKESIIRFYVQYLNSSLDFSDVDTVFDAVMKYISLWINEKELVKLLKKRELIYLLSVANMEYSKNAIRSEFDRLFSNEAYDNSEEYLIDLIVYMEAALFRTWIENDYEMSMDYVEQKLKDTFNLFKNIEFKKFISVED